MAVVVLGLVLMGFAGCGDAKLGSGEACGKNSDCAAPLVCRLGSCRNECNNTRDCPIPASCVQDNGGFGVCQLAREVSCSLDSECADPLRCRNNQCANVCATDRDCPPGAACEGSPAGCVDPAASRACEFDGDCMRPLVCRDSQCVEECRSSRDCLFGRACDPSDGRCKDPKIILPFDAGPPPPGDAGPRPDAGPRADAGPTCADPTTEVVDLDLGYSGSGATHACAVLSTGEVYCWGDNFFADLGSERVGAGRIRWPVRVDGITDAERVDVGATTCALHRDGRLSCWGYNGYGGVGIGSPDGAIRVPMTVALSPVSDAAMSIGSPNCAIQAGELYCWGEARYGALGEGRTSGEIERSPIRATLIPSAQKIATGFFTACAIVSGDAVCWGQFFGATPLAPTMLGDVIDVSIESQHACLVRAGGQVLCMGSNMFGALGGAVGATGTTFGELPDITDAVQVDTSTYRACARTATGLIRCWGNNAGGELGDGTTTHRSRPTAGVVGLGAASDFALGSTTGCAIVDGEVWCWGGDHAVRGIDVTSPEAARVECLP